METSISSDQSGSTVSFGLLGLLPDDTLRQIFAEGPKDKLATIFQFIARLHIATGCSSQVFHKFLKFVTRIDISHIRDLLNVCCWMEELVSLRHLYIHEPAIGLAADHSHLIRCLQQLSPRLQTFSWLWFSQSIFSPSLKTYYLEEMSWPELETLEFRAATYDTANVRWETLLTSKPKLKNVRVIISDGILIALQLKAALKPVAHQLEELFVQVIEIHKGSDVVQVPVDHMQIYEVLPETEFPKLRIFATDNLPPINRSTTLERLKRHPLRGNIWSITSRTNLLTHSSIMHGLSDYQNPNISLDGLLSDHARIHPLGTINPMIYATKFRLPDVADVVFGMFYLGVDPFERCSMPLADTISEVSVHGNFFTFALWSPWEPLFEAAFCFKPQGQTLWELGKARQRSRFLEASLDIDCHGGILHCMITFSYVRKRVTWIIEHYKELGIDLNGRDSFGAAVVHRIKYLEHYDALARSGGCDMNATYGHSCLTPLECAVENEAYELASTLYARPGLFRLTERLFLTVARRAAIDMNPTKPESPWQELAFNLFRDATIQMRFFPIDQLNADAIKVFQTVFVRGERGITWAKLKYRESLEVTIYETLLHLTMARLDVNNGLKAIIQYLSDPNVEEEDLVGRKHVIRGATALHLLADADFCSLIDNDENANYLGEIIDILQNLKNVDPTLTTLDDGKSALDLVLNKRTFQPTEKAKRVFCARLVNGIDMFAPEPTPPVEHSPWAGSVLLQQSDPLEAEQQFGDFYDEVEAMRAAIEASLRESGSLQVQLSEASNTLKNIDRLGYDDDYEISPVLAAKIEDNEDELLRQALALSLALDESEGQEKDENHEREQSNLFDPHLDFDDEFSDVDL